MIAPELLPWVMLILSLAMLGIWWASIAAVQKASSSQFRSALTQTLEAVPAGIVVVDDAGTVLEVNRSAQQMFRRFSMDVAPGSQPDLDSFWSRCRAYEGSMLPGQMHSMPEGDVDYGVYEPREPLWIEQEPASEDGQSGQTARTPRRGDLPDGGTRPQERYLVQRRVVEGISLNRRAVRVIWSVTDVSSWARREDILRVRESQFASILESSMDVIMRVEETGRITLVNERGAALLDTDKASLIGQRLGDVLPSPSGAALEARVYKVCVSGLPDSYLEMRDGRWFEYRLAPMDPEANGYRAVTVICRDMTPERRLEQEVRQRERFNRLIADNLPGLVLYVDRSEMLRFVNDRIVDWTGQPSTELIGRRIEEVLVPSIGQEVLRHRAQALSGRVAEFEASFTDSQGRGVRYHASLLPHQDDDGRVLGFVGLLLDISTRHEAEQATRSALDAAEQANSAKTRFLAAASHDLRQPMQALNIYINLLRAKTRDMEELDDLVRRASLSLDALGGLLDNLLDISKLEAGIIQAQPGTVPLQDLFDRMDAEMRPQFERKGLELRFSLCACTVRSDAVLLERVVRNLLTNALRYTHRGGVMLSCRKRSETVLLQVWDTGIGIPADRLELIFEEFYQIGNEERDRRQGLGVGLAIVRRLSALLEHDLSVRSVVDKGTVFTLVLPREVAVPDAEQRLEAGAALQRSASPEGAEDLSGRIICAIDDDPDVLDGLALQLEAWGVSVIAAGDLAEALEFLRDEERPPDVVMADYRLANGAKGTAAIRTIRLAFGSEIPGVVLTGDTSPDRLREVSAAGVHLLHKPVKSQDLQETLSEALKAKSA